MKIARIPLLPALAMILLAAGGCSRHYVDVYINEECFPVTHDNDTVINPLLVFPEDYVIFNNLTDKDVELGLPAGVFEVTSAAIAGYERVIVKVVAKSKVETNMTIKCTGGSTTPKVFVGEEP